MINPINIAIAEDHLLMRQAMVCLMKNMNNINVLFDTDNSRDLFVKLRHSKPDIILMDTELNLRDKQSLVKRILSKFPTLKLIIVSSAHSQNSITEFIHLGVRAFLPKNCDCFKVVDIINKVHLDGHYFDNKISLLLGKTERPPLHERKKYANICKIHFTGRELEVLNQICLNKTNKEIADTLALSIRTVEGHRLNIMKKAHSKNIIDLTHFAQHYNLIRL